MRATQLPEEQANLLGKLRGNTTFQEAVLGTLNLSLGNGAIDFIGPLAHHVESAYAYFVTKDMATLVEHAADALDEEDLFDARLAPTGTGIVRFEKPLTMFDVRNKQMKANWATWGPIPGGTLLTFWNDVRDPDEVSKLLQNQFGTAMVQRVIGNWSVLGGSRVKHGNSLGPMRIPIPENYAAKVEAEGDTPTPFTSGERLIHALWLMLNQTLVSTREEQVRPKQTHHARRLKLHTKVTVIDLRRIEGAKRGEGESHIEWRSRWVVRGHWRWQAYGPGRTERRRIWVAPFIKGPEDKPLVVNEHVYALRR